MGTGALGGAIAGGENNVAVGHFALDALTSGDENAVVTFCNSALYPTKTLVPPSVKSVPAP